MKITSLDQVEKTKMMMEGAKDVWKQIPISKADGTPSLSFRVFTILTGLADFRAKRALIG